MSNKILLSDCILKKIKKPRGAVSTKDFYKWNE